MSCMRATSLLPRHMCGWKTAASWTAAPCCRRLYCIPKLLHRCRPYSHGCCSYPSVAREQERPSPLAHRQRFVTRSSATNAGFHVSHLSHPLPVTESAIIYFITSMSTTEKKRRVPEPARIETLSARQKASLCTNAAFKKEIRPCPLKKLC